MIGRQPGTLSCDWLQYRGVLEAYTTIAAREGLAGGLYRGLGPNIVRNGIVNVCETVGDMEKWININD